jgi:L-malate glycosyltransferase
LSQSNPSKKIRVCIVGNLLGRNPGYVTSQGQILADLLSKDGYTVISCSSKINRLLRWVDIVFTIIWNRKKFDVMILEVYSGLNILMSETASFLGELLHIPMVFVLHGGNLPQFSRRYPRSVRRVLARADILAAPSTFLVKGLKHLGFPIRVIRNIVEIDQYPFKVRRKAEAKFVWMRSFHPIYNPQLAVEVFRDIRRSHPDARMVMAGLDKGLEPEIKSMVADFNLEDAVRFPGFLGHEAKIKEYSDADIYLNTNRIDNTPVAVIEACAMGLPVVTTNVGGLPDLIDNGMTGILVSDGNVNSMVDAVNWLLDDDQSTEKLSKNGRLLAEKSSWSSVRNSWNEVFAEIMSERPQQTLRSFSFRTSK